MDFGATILTRIQTNGILMDLEVPRLTICPTCHNAIAEHIFFSYAFPTPSDNFRISAMFQCNHCFTPFICVYNQQEDNSFTLMKVGPIAIKSHPFPEEIQTLSTRFIDIYNQAYAAEQYGLNEVCGMAFRKALEFLLKTYLIQKNPKDEKLIAEMTLGKCIKQYVNNGRIQTTAERCAWLGNDHSHYLNHHTENDLKDLKKLLHVVINWVENELIMDAAPGIPPKDPL